MDKNDKLLTSKEAAKFLNMSVQALAEWRFKNKGPRYIKYSAKMVRYKESDLQSWLNENLIDPGAI